MEVGTLSSLRLPTDLLPPPALIQGVHTKYYVARFRFSLSTSGMLPLEVYSVHDDLYLTALGLKINRRSSGTLAHTNRLGSVPSERKVSLVSL